MKKLIFLFFAILLFADEVFIEPGCYLCPSENALYKVMQIEKYSPADARSLARDYNCYITTSYIKVELATEGSLNRVYVSGYGYYYATPNCITFQK